MTQTVVTRALARLGIAWASAAACLIVLLGPALAGDRALLEVIGYSRDSHYLAFEEYGIQDGSGFAYSSIYVVDLSEDNWVVGTPIRLQADDETTLLTAVRAEVRAKAEPALTTLGIDAPAQMLALIGDGALDGKGDSLHFGLPRFGPGDVEGDYALTLTSKETPAMTPCVEWFSAKALGYRLRVSDGNGDRVVHVDDVLPRSRGCPVAYRLYGVLAPWTDDPLPHAVALISVYAQGFEGPDRRFIAVPLGF